MSWMDSVDDIIVQEVEDVPREEEEEECEQLFVISVIEKESLILKLLYMSAGSLVISAANTFKS